MRLISACLCGINCKYNGKNNYNPVFEDMLKKEQLIPICPEKMGGLYAPRSPCEIWGGTGEQVLAGKARVISNEGRDLTAAFVKGAEKTLKVAIDLGIKEAIFQSRSPSCGCGYIYDGTFSSQLIKGDGVTTALLRRHGIKVINEADYLSNLL
ncbi:MAG: DUF523 domain-containing protein [Syntrophomonadaceae bacterium]|nr:DUF523 domain-containing protein [Syntrophomonadaceae bacterium]